MEITLLANAGVVVNWAGRRWMFDGIFRPEGLPFSQIPAAFREDLLAGRAPLGQIDQLLFTHLHRDHFCGEDVSRYLRAAPPKGLWLPPGGQRQLGADIPPSTECSVLACPIGGSEQFTLEGGLTLTAFNTGHMGEDYRGQDNFCFVLRGGGRGMLVTGDADFNAEAFKHAAAGGRVACALVNPLFLQNPEGRRILAALAPEVVVVYHIPFEGDDPHNIRALARRQAERWDGVHHRVLPLMQPLQTLRL